MSQISCCAVISSPIGKLYCAAVDDAVISLSFTPQQIGHTDVSNPFIAELQHQLKAYFNGTLLAFDIPIKLSGTLHQHKVWDELQSIPYGETVSYQQIAKAIGSAPIAVGQAVGRNPVNILIPCHRVIGTNGSLTGYNGGLQRKRFLLDLEARIK